MSEINIDDLPGLEFDAGVPDAGWGETTTASVTIIVAGIVAILM